MNPTNSLATDHAPVRDYADKVLVRALRLDVSAPTRDAAGKKAARLFRHHARVIRVRIDLARHNAQDQTDAFVARGRVEVSGPDLTAEAASDGVLKSVDFLIDKLDRMLRERTRTRTNRRNDRHAGTEFRDRLAVPAAGHEHGTNGGEP